jgi:hypothetical protein
MRDETPAECAILSTVKIQSVNADGRPYSGTAFFLAHRVGEKTFGFVVTCSHVVREAKSGTLVFQVDEGGQPKFGISCTISVAEFASLWFHNPDPGIDVAVCLIDPFLDFAKTNLKTQLYFQVLNSDSVPDPGYISELDAIEDILFIGYPSGIVEQSMLLPISRKGVTATPYAVDFNGRAAFLIDGSVFPGSSGSPVFKIERWQRLTRKGTPETANRTMLLGMVALAFFHAPETDIALGNIPGAALDKNDHREMIDLGYVVKTREIVSTIKLFLDRQNP